MATKLHKTARWRKLRDRVFRREPLCRKCKSRFATELDHIKPVKRGGAFWDAYNLQPLCRDCHEAKTAAENRRDNPRICRHGWPSDLKEPCPDCPPGACESDADEAG